MAHPLPPGLTPAEVSFLCEMEMVTIVPRSRLDSIPLLSVRLLFAIYIHLSITNSE